MAVLLAHGCWMMTVVLPMIVLWSVRKPTGEYQATYDSYRLITAYLLLRVSCDKIMHAWWDFDVLSVPERECIGQKSKLKQKCIIL